jgi:hypothetical protein
MIGLALLTAHLIADFPLQSDFMARRKLDWHSARLYHVLVHVVVTAVVLYPVVGDKAAFMAAVVGVLHYCIDTQRWAEPKDGLESYPIVIDQVMHVATLYLVGVAFTVIL